MWTVTDNESGIAIDIREGLFNDSQDVVICLKFTTFVVATTVDHLMYILQARL